MLDGRSKLERVHWNNPVVGFGGGDEERGIGNPGGDVVIRRIGQQPLERFRILVGIAVLDGPIAAGGEVLVSEHVGHRHLRNDGAEQVGPLNHGGRGQQATVGAAPDSDRARSPRLRRR